MKGNLKLDNWRLGGGRRWRRNWQEMQSFYLPHREWVIPARKTQNLYFSGLRPRGPSCCPPTIFSSQALDEFLFCFFLISLKVADKAVPLFIHSKFLANAQNKKARDATKKREEAFIPLLCFQPFVWLSQLFFFFWRLAIIPSLLQSLSVPPTFVETICNANGCRILNRLHPLPQMLNKAENEDKQWYGCEQFE